MDYCLGHNGWKDEYCSKICLRQIQSNNGSHDWVCVADYTLYQIKTGLGNLVPNLN